MAPSSWLMDLRPKWKTQQHKHLKSKSCRYYTPASAASSKNHLTVRSLKPGTRESYLNTRTYSPIQLGEISFKQSVLWKGPAYLWKIPNSNIYLSRHSSEHFLGYLPPDKCATKPLPGEWITEQVGRKHENKMSFPASGIQFHRHIYPKSTQAFTHNCWKYFLTKVARTSANFLFDW